MRSETMSTGIREGKELREHRVHRPSQTPAGVSASSRAANREWYPGLCTTCENEINCTFPRSADHPVLTCDEFVGVVEPSPSPVVQSRRTDDRFAQANREWFPGLCKTCEKRETCTYPKPEGGVFNCDEFE